PTSWSTHQLARSTCVPGSLTIRTTVTGRSTRSRSTPAVGGSPTVGWRLGFIQWAEYWSATGRDSDLEFPGMKLLATLGGLLAHPSARFMSELRVHLSGGAHAIAGGPYPGLYTRTPAGDHVPFDSGPGLLETLRRAPQVPLRVLELDLESHDRANGPMVVG